MKFYLVNIYKIIILVFIIIFFIPALSNGAEASVIRDRQINIKQFPTIIELEDPLDMDKSQLIFPPEIFTSFGLKRHEYSESPFRRGQIIFFISFPYAYMYHLLIFEIISRSRFSQSKKITKYQYIYMLIISAIISSFVAYDDNVAVFKSPLEQLRIKKDFEKRFDFEIQLFRF